MAATFPKTPKAVGAARARRAARAGERAVRVEWFIENVSNKVSITMKQRVALATELIKNKVVQNISRPVSKGTGPRGGKVVSNRSKKGEYPKAETSLLMKLIFGVVKQVKKGTYDGYIGTPLDYGAILETSKGLDRSFLVRTLREESAKVKRILTGPIKT